MEEFIQKLRAYTMGRWKLGRTHGVSHWDRVYDNGLRLATDKTNARVLAAFAYVHDACREDDLWDMKHGPRAAEWIKTIRESYLKPLTDEEFELLQQACREHTSATKTGNPTVDACFDADRLDLWRVSIIPDPKKLATEEGKAIARSTNYEELIQNRIYNIIGPSKTMEENKEKTQNEAPKAPRTYHCNDCGNTIYRHEVFCSKCGKQLDRFDFED